MGIRERYERVRDEVADVCRQAGRAPSEVRLIAVSKTVDAEGARAAHMAGACDFGENRPDQIVLKSEALPDVRWHFIGNIQSRRIPDIVRSSTLVHSLFNISHARKIDAAAEALSKVQDVLVEVNVSGEESKGGLAPGEVADFVAACAAFEHVRVRGLMTMAPQGDLAEARKCFEGLAAIRAEVGATLDADRAACFDELSMGMSEDWQEAVYAGATMVRIGRAIFSDAFE